MSPWTRGLLTNCLRCIADSLNSRSSDAPLNVPSLKLMRFPTVSTVKGKLNFSWISRQVYYG